ncbi:archaeosortase/exosortase family protein [Hymenobacter sp. BT559]|nr:archaeosortase/exosortase family protein [Hymenobacter sp. BT559]
MRMSTPLLPTPSRATSPLLRFAVLASGLYLLWFLGYEHYLAADGRLDAALTHNLAAVGVAGLRLLGYDATVSGGAQPLISLAGQPVVFIWHPCNGLVLYALFSGFIIAFPGPVRRKLWFIPLGILLIYSLNVLRIIALSFNNYYDYQSVDFNHHYTFTAIVYAGIFGLWMWWATRGAATSRLPADAYAAA